MAETDPEEDSGLVYYYSRERRLERASSTVRAMNTRPGPRKAGMNRSSFLILALVLMMGVMYALGSRAAPREAGEFSLGHNTIVLSVFQEETALFLSVEKSAPQEGEAYTGPVDLIASPILAKGKGEPPVMMERMTFGPGSPESFSFSLPFEGDELMVMLKAGDETVTRRVRKSP